MGNQYFEAGKVAKVDLLIKKLTIYEVKVLVLNLKEFDGIW